MFLQNCLRVPGYPKIFNFGYPVPEITDNAQPYINHARSAGSNDHQNFIGNAMTTLFFEDLCNKLESSGLKEGIWVK